ncbi:MAG TPA: nucleotidyltransferase domain-containing protein [Pyrinomonadaceae bacterium]|jgi:predicted nucleotidyltransferase|nr:nucleotidyltransferase domain-containing protein [Pyrinomonadaceae bacterium]
MSATQNNLDRQQQAEVAAKQCERVLKDTFGVREVYVFGSLSGHSPWHSRSDVDLAVEGLAPERYIAALTACYALLPPGMELDLVTLETAPPELVAKAKREVDMPQDAADDFNAALKNEVALELNNLHRLVDESKAILNSSSEEPSSVELRALGSIVHDFYTACERIFERVAVYLGPGVPVGDNWHVSLLRSMELPIEGKRPAVIEHQLAWRLVDYLRFRHLFRHTYGYELKWEKLQALVERLETTRTSLSQQLDEFVLALPSLDKK